MSLAQNPACNPICRVCHYKNLDYPEQLARKTRWANEQLGPWKNALHEIIPAPETERLAYRSKSWMRSSFEDGEVSFGMFRATQVQGEWEKEFVSWDTCPLHVPPIQRMIQKLKPALAALSRDFLENSLVGVWIGSPHLVVVCREESSEEIRKLNWSEILVPPFDRVWFHCNTQVGRKVFGHREIEPVIGSWSGGANHPIRAFRQVAQSLLTRARASAIEALTSTAPSMILDLYCGTGDLSLLLPPSTGWLGIELSSEAIKYATTLRRPDRALHVAFVGTVEHRLRDPRVLKLIEGSYALYLNPPRMGLTDDARERVLDLVREKRPTSVVYLSCSASSLARDLTVFEREGFKVKSLQPYDFFPQTEHFETLAVLEHGIHAMPG